MSSETSAPTPMDPVGDVPTLVENDLFERAKGLHRSGDVAQACRLYQQILRQDCSHADALHLLGFAAFQCGAHDEAQELIGRAIAQRPGAGEFHINMALVQLCRGDAEKARAHVTRARELEYHEPMSFVHVGVELLQNDQMEMSRECFELALEQSPDLPEALHFLGLLYRKLGEFERAIDYYQAALRSAPAYCEARINLGNALRDSNRIEEAIVHYEQAIALEPAGAAAHNNLGVALYHQGQLQKAIGCFEAAHRLAPSADPLNNLGNSYRDLGMIDKAEAYFRQALELAPNSAEIHNNLGSTLRCAEKQAEAIESFQQSLSIAPDQSQVVSNLAAALVDVGQYELAREQYRRAARLLPDEPLLQLRCDMIVPAVFENSAAMESTLASTISTLDSYSDAELPNDLFELTHRAAPPPFNLQFFHQNLREVRESYARVFSRLSSVASGPTKPASPNSPHRIGIVVTNRHEGIFLKSLRGVLERIDTGKFEIHIIASPAGLQRVARELHSDDIRYWKLPARLDRAANLIRSANLDLLYYWEIGTDSTNYFLPFLRLAPTQCTSWGIQVTSGIPAVDYYLSSRHVEPPDAQDHYTERLVLADALLCYRERLTCSSSGGTKSYFGFGERETIYLCAQQVGKFHPDFDPVLRDILLHNSASRLVLTADWNQKTAIALRDRLTRSLGSAADQIVFLPRQDLDDYRRLLQASDVLLDPPYFGGVNTTYDGLSFGKPIVTVPSKFHRGRYTYGCYQAMELRDCTASDLAEYVELAQRLGSDSDFRESVSTAILERSELLFEDNAAVSEHERIFAELIARHEAGGH